MSRITFTGLFPANRLANVLANYTKTNEQ